MKTWRDYTELPTEYNHKVDFRIVVEALLTDEQEQRVIDYVNYAAKAYIHAPNYSGAEHVRTERLTGRTHLEFSLQLYKTKDLEDFFQYLMVFVFSGTNERRDGTRLVEGMGLNSLIEVLVTSRYRHEFETYAFDSRDRTKVVIVTNSPREPSLNYLGFTEETS